jgi:hypothetical protein
VSGTGLTAGPTRLPSNRSRSCCWLAPSSHTHWSHLRAVTGTEPGAAPTRSQGRRPARGLVGRWAPGGRDATDQPKQARHPRRRCPEH